MQLRELSFRSCCGYFWLLLPKVRLSYFQNNMSFISTFISALFEWAVVFLSNQLHLRQGLHRRQQRQEVSRRRRVQRRHRLPKRPMQKHGRQLPVRLPGRDGLQRDDERVRRRERVRQIGRSELFASVNSP